MSQPPPVDEIAKHAMRRGRTADIPIQTKSTFTITTVPSPRLFRPGGIFNMTVDAAPQAATHRRALRLPRRGLILIEGVGRHRQGRAEALQDCQPRSVQENAYGVRTAVPLPHSLKISDLSGDGYSEDILMLLEGSHHGGGSALARRSPAPGLRGYRLRRAAHRRRRPPQSATVPQHAQLFERLETFDRRYRELCVAGEKTRTVGIDAQVTVDPAEPIRLGSNGFVEDIALPGYGRPAEIERIAVAIAHDLDRIHVEQLRPDRIRPPQASPFLRRHATPAPWQPVTATPGHQWFVALQIDDQGVGRPPERIDHLGDAIRAADMIRRCHADRAENPLRRRGSSNRRSRSRPRRHHFRVHARRRGESSVCRRCPAGVCRADAATRSAQGSRHENRPYD